jgi:hypothetical protein
VVSGFTCSSKDDVLQIFIALKSPSPWAESELANLGSNGKHANHYNTEDNQLAAYGVAILL